MQIRVFAQALAAALGCNIAGCDEWTVEPATQDWHHNHPTIRRKDGPSFWLSGPANGAYAVHANYPKDSRGKEQRPYFSAYSDNGTQSPGINFSEKKSPEQAAKDIIRRFLPVYLPLWEKQLAQVNADNAFRVERHLDASAAASIIGGKVEEDHNGLASVRVPYLEKGPKVTDIELSRDSIRFTIEGDLNLLAHVQHLITQRR